MVRRDVVPAARINPSGMSPALLARRGRVALWLGLIALLPPGVVAADTWPHRGFAIDDTRVRKAADLEEVRQAIRQQIDIVAAVGLSADMMRFFQGVPLVVIPSDAIPRSSPGLYRPGSRDVQLTNRITTIGPRPVLLHELLHAYHAQRLPDGFKHRAILAFFEKARPSPAFAANSHMMQNPGEFFACAATTYLHGVTAQEPLQRAKLKEALPEFFAYLEKLFGPTAGTYSPSVTGQK